MFGYNPLSISLKDIGRPSPPQIDAANQTVSVEMNSSTQCDTNKRLNYSTIIIFRCKKGVDLVNIFVSLPFQAFIELFIG